MNRNILIVAVVALFFVACADTGKEAMKLADECEKLYENGKYDAALVLVDSLRRTYPEAVDARKKALSIYQKAELVKAQNDVVATDKELQAVNADFSILDSVVAHRKAEGVVTPEELTRHTRMRMKRDSLQTRFDVQCAKIRYIKQKMRE